MGTTRPVEHREFDPVIMATEKLILRAIISYLITFQPQKERNYSTIADLLRAGLVEDENGKMNKSLKDVNGELLLVSQFTLYGDTKNGNRPSFIEAARPEEANKMYEYIIEKCKEKILCMYTLSLLVMENRTKKELPGQLFGQAKPA